MATYSIDKIKYGDNVYSLIDNTSGYTKNTGTITGITMNGSSKGTSGIVNLGTVLTSHQDISGKADKATTLAGYGITNAYTKTEVDSMVSGVLHYKGTKATIGDLPSSGNTTGDVWHVTANGAEYAWDGNAWQELGTAVDLSNYVLTTDSRLSDARTPTAHNQALSTITGADDLKAIEALTGTSGLLKKTAANTWALDTTSYITDAGVTKITTTAGTHTAISNKTGAVSFNVPTKTSHLTNDSGFLTSHQTLNPPTIATDTGTSTLTLAHGGKYKLTTPGGSFIFTMPAAPSVPTSASTNTTGISISDHTTTTVTGVSGSTSVYGVKSGTNSTTTASKASGGNGSASSWTFESKSIPNVTAAGSGSYTQGSFSGGSLTFTMDTTDTKQLNIAFTAATHGTDSHTHTAPTLGTAITVYSKSGGSNGSAPTWSFTDVTVPIRADSATTVPTAASSATTVVTGKTHSITDNGHTHTLS